MPPELALLGCGAAAQAHSRVLARVAPGVRRWYASRDGERAREAARRLRGAGGLEGYEAALAHPDLAAVVVATPPGTHAELTLAALEAGKHVLVEKPAFATLADFDAVAEAAARASRQVHVLENYPYKPLADWLRQRLASGDLGTPLLLAVDAAKRQPEVGWRRDPLLGAGGPLLEGGVHWISLLTSLGLPVEDVDAWAGPTGEATAHLVLAYAGSTVGHLDFSWQAHAPLRGARLSHVRGTTGTLTFESNGAFLVEHGRRVSLRLADPRRLSGHEPMWRAVLRALATRTEPAYGLAHARRDVELALRARARIAERTRAGAGPIGG
jgi:predicted dehydrogenase